ncbi:MAG: phosphate-starvation-inducible PsiE family protein [Acidimicrobiales bacterium]|nr:phosphate-starvation-inducible PsiE family protein [Acidimicrobiales bacterium]
MADGPDQHGAIGAIVDRSMRGAEQLVYAVVGLLLLLSALGTVGAIGYRLVTDADDGVLDAVTTALDGLLLVFILVELLGAVRATISERKLVAEPFLIVGIIASIKEIIVASLKAADAKGEAFEDAMAEVGVLGGVVLVLAISSYLVRRKEREPAED